MNIIIKLLFFMPLTLLLSSCLGNEEAMQVPKKQSVFPAEQKASQLHNTGEVNLSMLKKSGNTMIVSFVFEPKSRNFWHYHQDIEQTILVLDGEGFYQEEGQTKRVIKKGDVIITPPNVRHWNGATNNENLVCITITEHAVENHAVQLRAVTDEEYNSNK